MANLLEQLKAHSTVVADTGDLETISRFRPVDATTNPSLVLKAAMSGQYEDLLETVIDRLRSSPAALAEKIEDACDRLTVEMGCMILQRIPGRVSTEVSARLSFDLEGSLAKARRLVALYREAGVPTERILIKLAATWEGIRAAEILEREGIQCNLTLIFNLAQARACAEAGVYLISPFVGRILDWHRRAEPERLFEPAQEPGVLSVRSIYRYLRERSYPTLIMGASFRNAGEVLALAGCDRLTISPALLEELAGMDGTLNVAVTDTGERAERPEPLTEPEFRWQLNADPMATEKLAEGIRGFDADQQKLEALLRDRLA